MGYAVAGECIRRGAEVILISGPSALQAPRGLKAFVKVETAGEMREAVFKNLSKTDIVIMAAAPADFLPEKKEKIKIDKSEKLSIKFKNTPDILAEIGKLKKRPLLVGFAAETGKRLDRARAKRMRKGADIIVFNDVTEAGSGFDVDTNKITIIGKDREKPLPMMTKHEASEAILDVVSECLRK